MVPRDTSLPAAEVQIEVHRHFSAAQRLRMTIEMSEFARTLSKTGLRRRRPDLTEREIDAEMLNEMYGLRLPPA